MKRHGNLFERIASFPNLLAAEKTALRGRRARSAPALFHHDLEPTPYKCVVIPVRDGVPFLGWRLYPDHRRLRRSSGVRFQRRLRSLAKAYGDGEIGPEKIRASLASSLGHLGHGDTHGLVRKLLRDTVFRRQPQDRSEDITHEAS